MLGTANKANLHEEFFNKISINKNSDTKMLLATIINKNKKAWSEENLISRIFSADLIIFTEEIFNGKLHFFCVVERAKIWNRDTVTFFYVSIRYDKHLTVCMFVLPTQVFHFSETKFFKKSFSYKKSGMVNGYIRWRCTKMKFSIKGVISKCDHIAISCGFGHIY